MLINRRKLFLAFIYGYSMLASIALSGQSTFRSLASDTIVQRQEFLGRGYYLDGKRLNLAVMEWFMSDYPGAQEQIGLASVSDQMSAVTYTTGGLFILGSILVRKDDLNLSNDMLKLGVLAGGAGVVFQILEVTFKKSAVQKYNEGVRSHHQAMSSLMVGVEGSGVGVAWRF